MAAMPLPPLMRVKPFVAADSPTELKRTLGAWDLVLMGVGCVIGTGIFVLTGTAAANYAGPAVVLSYVLAGVACAFAALAYAELASAVGGGGSAYTYAYSGIGELLAWIIGWDLILEYGLATATVASGWSGYLVKLLALGGVAIPPAWTTATFDSEAGGLFNAPAAFIVLALSGLLIWGVRESARFNAVMVAVKLTTIVVFLAVAAPHIVPANWTPFVPPGGVDATGAPVFGWAGVTRAASIIFFAYIGFDAVSTAGEETKNPQRDLPIGIIGSLLICTVLYLAVAATLTGVVKYTKIDIHAPVAAALEGLGIGWATWLVTIGALAGITTVMLVLYYGLTRIILAMARDGLMPNALAKIDPRTKTPIRLILIGGVLISLLAGLTPIDKLVKLVSVGTLLAFVVVCASVIVMRRTRPNMPRPFKVPLYPVTPILGMLFCGFILTTLDRETWLRYVVWMAIGMVVYFFWSRSNAARLHPYRGKEVPMPPTPY